MTLKEQAWQSGLVLLDETPEWNENDWPPLEGPWRFHHATVVLDNNDHNNNNKGQSVVVTGGYYRGDDITNSVLVLNLADPDKQWRRGPPMNKQRGKHAAVVCDGGIYVIGGDHLDSSNLDSSFDCMERIDSNDLLKSSLTTMSTHESNWTTLNCRLVTGRKSCCAVAVHNRYIVVTGGYDDGLDLSSVEIIDTCNHTVTTGPCMNVPRSGFGSAVIGHRIFVVGGESCNDEVDSVEYLDFAKPCYNEESKGDALSTVMSSLCGWTTHSDLALSVPRGFCEVAAVGSCLVAAGGYIRTVEVLDTHRNRVWDLPLLENCLASGSVVTVADQIALIGGWNTPSCLTLPLMDRNSWCFRRLCEQPPKGWYHSWEGGSIRGADISPFSTSTLARQLARPNTSHGDEVEDGT